MQAREQGWIVSRYCDDPGTIPVPTKWGRRIHGCDGTYSFI